MRKLLSSYYLRATADEALLTSGPARRISAVARSTGPRYQALRR
ncbi:MAG: hypothetical protein ABI596_15545 [Pyrinomonadaceae bacterium]